MTTANRIRTVLILAFVVTAIIGLSINPASAVEGELGILTPATLAGNNPATGAPWAVGDAYRFAFITSTLQDATSTDINSYNTLVQGLANGSPLNIGAADGATWKVIGSTAAIDARDNTGTNPTVETGCTIFLLDGGTVVANNNADLWDGAVQNIINITEAGVVFVHWPFTGTYTDGTNAAGKPNSGGGPLGDPAQVAQGESGITTNWIWRQWTADPPATPLPLYAMSDPLHIVASGGPTFTTDKATYAYGEAVTIMWAGQPGNATDWIQLKVGGVDNGWAYTDGTAVGSTGVPTGSITVDAAFLARDPGGSQALPLPVGSYTAEFYLNDTFVVEATTAFTVLAPPGPVATMPTPAADVSEPGGMFYSFDVLYEDDVAVAGSSIGVGDVTVVGSGAPLTVVSAVAAPVGDAASVTVTYTVIPPGGVWDPADNYSTYTISLVAGEVLDTDGPNSAAGGTLDIFSVQVVPPYSDFITPVAVTASSEAAGSPAVNMINSSGMTENSSAGLHDNLNTGGSVWESTSGTVANEEVVFDLGQTYDLSRAFIWQYNRNYNNGYWQTRGVATMNVLVSTDNVTFTPVGGLVTLARGTGLPGLPAQVKPLVATNVRYVKFDIQTALSGQPDYIVGLSEVRFGAALGATPIGRITEPAPDVDPLAGETNYTFTVSYADDVGIDVSTLDINDVTVTGPYGDLTIESQIVSTTATAPFVSVQYTVTAPGGSWGLADVGEYTISVAADQVFDTDATPNSVVATTLDTFEVILPLEGHAALVYEPFDYAIGANINGQNGGKGFSDPWQSNISHGQIYLMKATGSTFLNLPVIGKELSRSGNAGRAQANRLLTAEARTALTADNTTVWFSTLFAGPSANRGAMFILASQPLNHTNLYTMPAPGVGFGYSIHSPNDGTISAVAYNNSVDVTIESGINYIPVLPPLATHHVTSLLVGKINWKPNGTPDEFFLFSVSNLVTEPAEATAIASITYMDFDQSAIDRVALCDGTTAITDEIRLGLTFDAVMGGADLPTPDPKLVVSVPEMPTAVTGSVADPTAITILLTNEQGGPLNLSDFQIGGADAGEFSFVGDPNAGAPQTVLFGTSYALEILWTPNTAVGGERSATVTVQHNAWNMGSPVTLLLNPSVVANLLQVTRTGALEVYRINEGQVTTITLTMTNHVASERGIDLTTFTLTGAHAGEFAASSPTSGSLPSSVTLAQGESFVIDLVWTPNDTVLGVRDATFSFEHTGDNIASPYVLLLAHEIRELTTGEQLSVA